jgi:hypothetical protein
MKKIYAGTKLAAVILDTEEEIETVVMALADFLPRSGGGLRSTGAELLGELTAPAPE